MNSVNRDDAIQMVNTINKLHDGVGQFSNKRGFRPSPNSQAASEVTTFQRPESLTTAYSQGILLIEVAADHLMALTKTVSELVQTIAPWSCIRAFVESTALASWLLDPNIDSKNRVQKSFAFRYEGLIEELKFWTSSGSKEASLKIVSRIGEVEQVALGLGFKKFATFRV